MIIKASMAAIIAVACVYHADRASAREVLAPPAQYDFEPRQEYAVVEASQAFLNKKCALDLLKARDPAARVLACTDTRSFIFILKGLSPSLREQTLRHEKAHLNGWRH